MLNSIQGLGKQGYGLLYIVPATYLYLLTTDTSVPIPFLGTINPGILTVLFLLFSLYSVLWLHHASLLIFGNHAGLASTRKSTVSQKHILFFATGVKPQELPDTSSLLALIKGAVESPDMRWGVFLRFIPAGLYSFYEFIAWLWLSLLFIDSDGTLISGAFWLGLSVMVFKSKVVGYLPNYIPPKSVKGIDEAEYIMTHQSVYEEDNNANNRPRIKKQQSIDSNRQIR